MSSLQDKFISETYTGLLHSDGVLPSSGQTIIYDGSGNNSALSVGRSGNGATVSGQLSASSLTVGNIAYPTVAGAVGAVVVQSNNNQLEFSNSLPSSILENLSPNPAGTYGKTTPFNSGSHIYNFKVNSKGLITEINTISDKYPSHTSDYYTISYMRNGGVSPNSITLQSGNTSWQKILLNSVDEDIGFGSRPVAVTIGISPKEVNNNDRLVGACDTKPLVIRCSNTDDGSDGDYLAVLEYSPTQFTFHRQITVKLGRDNSDRACLWFKYGNSNYPHNIQLEIEIIAAHM